MCCSRSVSKVKKFTRQNWESDKERIQNLLIDTKVDSSPNLNNDYCLTLDVALSNHREFLKRCTNFKFPNIKYMEFAGMQKHNKEISSEFESFFKKSLPYSVDYLVLKNTVKKAEATDLKATFDYLALAFDSTITEVYLSGFNINSSALSTVFQHCANCGRVVLNNCSIKIDDEFKVDFKTLFTIETLDLFDSYYPSNSETLDKKGLETLANVMQKSSLLKSIGQLHISSYLVDGVDSKGKEEQDMFTNKKFRLQVIADHNMPISGAKHSNTYAKVW